MDNIERASNPVEVESIEPDIISSLDREICAAVEALLFVSPNPLTEGQLARIIGKDKCHVKVIIEQLNHLYSESGRSFRIESYGGNLRFYTIPEFDKYISRLAEIPRPARLSRAALEVLAIIAYRQPLVKSEVEKIRGVDSDGVIRTLLEKGLIATCGRAEAPGRPLLYETTLEFLEYFGIGNISELPSPEAFTANQESAKSITLERPPENLESTGN